MDPLEIYEYDQLAFSRIVFKPERGAIIRARIVYVDAPVQLPGQSLAIYADEVIGRGGSIDLSGSYPKSSYRSGERAVDGTAPGQPGTDGRPGSDGQSSGPLKIYARRLSGSMTFRLVGGDGGRGEDGGFGAAGARGLDSNPGGRQGAPGGSGQDGGAPGKAGLSGSGGNGGLLQIGTIVPLDPQLLATIQATKVDAGKGGPAAVAGSPGAGGPGGAGGEEGHMEHRHRGGTHGTEDFDYDVWVKTGNYPNGPAGATPLAASPGLPGNPGQPGQINVSAITPADIAQGESARHLQALLEAAEGDYLDGRYDEAATRLAYLLAVASSRAGVTI